MRGSRIGNLGFCCWGFAGSYGLCCILWSIVAVVVELSPSCAFWRPVVGNGGMESKP